MLQNTWTWIKAKIRWFLIATGIVATGIVVIALGASHTQVELQWMKSYGTALFDTPSGDMEAGYYAIHPQTVRATEYIVRTRDADTFQFESREASRVNRTGLQRANIIGTAYYAEFLDPTDGSIVRERISREENDRNVPPIRTIRRFNLTNRAYAAIAFNATTTDDCAVCSSLTYAHTVSGSNTFLKVGVVMNSSTNSSVTYNTVTMNVTGDANAGGGNRARMLDLEAPSDGSNNVVVTQASLDNITSDAASYTGVDQTTPVDTAATATGNSTAVTVDVSSETDDLVVDVVTWQGGGGTITAGASQTDRVNIAPANGASLAQSEEAGAGTVTMSWTKSASGLWGTIGVNINAAADAEVSEVADNDYINVILW